MSSYWPGPHSRRGLIICLIIFVGLGIMAFYLSAQDSQPAPVITQPSR